MINYSEINGKNLCFGSPVNMLKMPLCVPWAPKLMKSRCPPAPPRPAPRPPAGSPGAPGAEIRLPGGEHLEAGRLLPAAGAVRGAARGPAARLLREVRRHVAGAGQRLRGLPVSPRGNEPNRVSGTSPTLNFPSETVESASGVERRAIILIASHGR